MNRLSKDFKESILSSEAANLAQDYSEIALDSILKDGVLKDLPIIGTVLGLYKMGYSIKERHTIKKILTFLNCMNDISGDEKEKFVERLNDEDKNGELFEKLLITLDRLDETIKAEMIGNLFRMYIMDVFDRQMFLRCSNIVERAFVSDLIHFYIREYYIIGRKRRDEDRFKIYMNRNGRADDLEHSLLNLGVMDQKIKLRAPHGARSDNPNKEAYFETRINSVGSTLAAFVFYDLKDEDFRRYMEREKKENLALREVYAKYNS